VCNLAIYFQRQRNELDSLIDKSKQVADKIVMSDEIQSETDSLVKQWTELEREMSSRIMLITDVGEKWKSVEENYRKVAIESTRINDALSNIDQVIRTKNQLVESLAALYVSVILVHFYDISLT
jgi:methyl-accepting chemotaxis protein